MVEPVCRAPALHVQDASRAVGVVTRLLSDAQREALIEQTRSSYAEIREQRAQGGGRKQLSLQDARARRLQIDFEADPPRVPAQPGVHDLRETTIATLRGFIDWTPFFRTWELKGRYPLILDHPVMGAQARELLSDAEAMLDRIEAEGWIEPRAVVGIFPANTVGDDIHVYTDASRSEVRAVLPTTRQLTEKSGDQPHLALADFLAPVGTQDWLGAFVVTTGHGVRERVEAFKADGDDYSAILLEALADRLVEASAEAHHMRVRREIWGYAPEETLENAALISEGYAGIRPAPGYPACPDHTDKRILFELLDAETATGASLTETCAIDPAASVAGWYFAHPQARYFGVGKKR